MTRRRAVRWWRPLAARPRLMAAAAVAVALALATPHHLASHAVTRVLIGWNAGTLLYVLLVGVMVARSTPQALHRRAQLEDEGQTVVLLLALCAAVVSLFAIVGELAVSRHLTDWRKTAHVALAGVTVLASWAFVHTMFALHYAHEYYLAKARGRPPGLDFPGDGEPNYGDFIYVACVIGTSGQTADVAFTTSPMRRLCSLHCVLSFLFNATVLALTINIAASLL